VARRLNISPRNLSKLTGSVYFEPGRFNLGLNIKFSGKNLQVPGYTRKLGDGPWEFSERAIQLIADYKAKFPRVFELLDFGEEPFDIRHFYYKCTYQYNFRDVSIGDIGPNYNHLNYYYA
jgi:hypothetical protein